MDYERERLIGICIGKLSPAQRDQYAHSVRIIAHSAMDVTTVQKLADLTPDQLTRYIDHLVEPH